MFPIAALLCIVSVNGIEVSRFHHPAVNRVQIKSPPCDHLENQTHHHKNGSAHHAKNESASRGSNSQSPDHEVEDFHPDNSPCGRRGADGMNSPGSAEGEAEVVIPQAQVNEGVKAVCGELTDGESDSAKACAKLDKDKKDGISKEEFKEWMKANEDEFTNPKMRDGDMQDAIFDAFSQGKDTLDASRCKALVKEHGTVLTLHLRRPD